MSFTTDIKEELSRVPPTCSHCEKATLSSLIRIEGSLVLQGAGNMSLEIDTDSSQAARLIVRLLHSLYQLKTDLTMRRSVLHKTPNYLINVPMQPALPDALRDLGVVSSTGFTQGIDSEIVKKRCCAAAYLRGVFLGCGFIANPKGDFHFEMPIESEEHAYGIVELLSEAGISAKTMPRRSHTIIYLKSGAAISDFLAFTGAHNAALAMENERVIKSVRNDVNRRVNAELANQQKTTEANVQQVMAIREVVDAYGLESLPAGLQEFIRLRVSHPDATLRELGDFANPPLSKSAIYHRVRRIEEMARQIHSS